MSRSHPDLRRGPAAVATPSTRQALSPDLGFHADGDQGAGRLLARRPLGARVRLLAAVRVHLRVLLCRLLPDFCWTVTERTQSQFCTDVNLCEFIKHPS